MDISLDKGRGKSSIRIVVEMPRVLAEWLRQPDSLRMLEEIEENNSRVGQLIIKLHDYDPFGRREGPRQFICLTDYLMVVLIMQQLSPIVSPYKDIMLDVQMKPHEFQTLSLRQFIPKEIEWGVATFVPSYTHVIRHLAKNKPLMFEIQYNDIRPTDCVRYEGDEKSSFPDEYILVRHDFDYRYFRVVSPIKILTTGFASYPFNSIVRDQMNRQLERRLQHCAKKPKTIDDDDWLPDLNQLSELPFVPPEEPPTSSISSIVQASLHAVNNKATSKRKHTTTNFHDRTPTTERPATKRVKRMENGENDVVDRIYGLIHDACM